MKGLMVSIMGSDCTNGGATSGKDHAVLEVKGCEVFNSGPDAPALVLLEDDGCTGYLNVTKNENEVHRVKAVPIIDGKPKAGMFGGNFIITSDSRFPYSSPIPVFDRFETAEEYYYLSR